MTAAMLYAFAALTRPSPAPSTVPGANIFTSAFILSIGIWAPVLMAFVIGVLPNPRGRYDTLIKQIAFFTNLIVLFILFVAYNQFQNFLPTLQYEENRQWLPAIGAAYHLGVDGPGILMLMLSALVGIISVLASTGIRTRVRSYFALLLLAQSCVTGAIAAHDLFVLVLFWSAATVPLALLILGWGGPRRDAAAWRLVGYWGAGTVALVLAVAGIYVATGGTSFDMEVVLKAPLGARAEVIIGLALVIAAATRLPLFPLHGWVRDVYSDAPIGVVVVVASSASRLGAYVLLRVLVAGEPDGAKLLAPLIAGLAAITVVYAAIAALRSSDIRHAAANLALVPCGVTALKLAWLTVLAGLGVLGVPLMASFTANEMTFFGAFRTQPVGAFAVAAGLALTAIAVAVLIQRVLFGPPNPDAPAVSDSSLSETWFLGLMAGALLWVGIVPGGPKIPGTDTPLFDPGVVNQMVANIPEIASPYSGTATP
ncbi:MAG: hypothetical protein E6H97_05490 [Chloroflexi bacterium]|nr:MAG: hypothetical protein E6H97_05490 [Chloroflexota bacterium]